jgi:hypothetical protein
VVSPRHLEAHAPRGAVTPELLEAFREQEPRRAVGFR